MRSSYTGHISSTEWRWTIVASVTLVLFAFAPFVWVLVSGITDSRWQFMGALHGYQIGALDLAQVYQGAQGDWLTRVLHTPEPHDGTFIGVIYTLLGHVSDLMSLSSIVVFHVARIMASLFMYIAIYVLGTNIWTRIRTRRIFFVFTAVGSGFGWVFAPLFGRDTYLDIIGRNAVPQIYPFYSSLINVAYPLAIGCLALIVAIFIYVWRPGTSNEPRIDNGGLVLGMLSFLLALVYPLAILPLVIAFLVCVVAYQMRHNRLPVNELRWLSWLIVASAPVLIYYIAVMIYNPIVQAVWTQRYGGVFTPPLIFVFSLGLPLILALPGLYRAVRRFEPDGDQFMLTWLLVMAVMFYLPVMIEHAFALGMMIPLGYFATRSIEDVWLTFINRRWRLRVIAMLLPIIAASNIFVLLLPIQPLRGGNFASVSGILLQRDYLAAFNWLSRRTDEHDVILAAPSTGLWLPVWTGAQVVYGTRDGTVEGREKLRAVVNWYREDDLSSCTRLLETMPTRNGRDYTIHYVIVGPREDDIGDATCAETLRPVAAFNSVRVYQHVPEVITSREIEGTSIE